jgi:methyl-accepting chemotaxis protein
VTTIVAAIAVSIEAQSTVTQGISDKIGKASDGIGDSNRRVAETTQVTQSIARDITEVSNVSKQMTAASESVRGATTQLLAQIQALHALADRFRTD